MLVKKVKVDSGYYIGNKKTTVILERHPSKDFENRCYFCGLIGCMPWCKLGVLSIKDIALNDYIYIPKNAKEA